MVHPLPVYVNRRLSSNPTGGFLNSLISTMYHHFGNQMLTWNSSDDDFINLTDLSVNNGNNGNDDVLNFWFLTILIIVGLFVNVSLICSFLCDESLLKKQFSWFILFQCIFDCLSLFIQLIVSVEVSYGSISFLELYFFIFFYDSFYIISLWMLASKCFVQQRYLLNMISTKSLAVSKTTAMLHSLKFFVPLWLTIIGLNVLFPTTIFNYFFQRYRINYPSFELKWYYFLLISHFVFFYVPGFFTMLFCGLTVKRLMSFRKKKNLILSENSMLQSAFNRRRQSAIVICIFMLLYIITLIPSETFILSYLFTNTLLRQSEWYVLCGDLTYIFYIINPFIVFFVCKDIRNALANVVKRLLSCL